METYYGVIEEVPLVRRVYRLFWIVEFCQIRNGRCYKNYCTTPKFTIKPYPNEECALTVCPKSNTEDPAFMKLSFFSVATAYSYTYQIICTIPSRLDLGTQSIQKMRNFDTRDISSNAFYSEDILKEISNKEGKIRFCFDIIRYPSENLQMPQKRIKYSKLANHFGSLLESGLHSDVTLRGNGYEFQAHKCILASRCSVFEGMFNHDLGERQTGVVQLSDEFQSDVMKEMLMFIYTNETSDVFSEMTFDLFKAADYYALDELKSICEHSFMENMSAKTAGSVYELASKYNGSKELKDHTLEFIRQNHVQVMKSSEFREFYRGTANLVLEIDDYIASKNKLDSK